MPLFRSTAALFLICLYMFGRDANRFPKRSKLALGPGKYQDLHLFQTWWRPRTNATWILPQAEPQGEWHGGPFQPVGGWRSPTNGSVSSFSAPWCVALPPSLSVTSS